MAQLLRFTGNPLFRLACLASALFAIVQLFWLGSKPIAVNLFNPPWDKVAHIATYLTFCLLLWLAAGLRRKIDIVIIIACISVADELHQIWLPGRSADWHDLMADTIGFVIFWLIASSFAKLLNAMTIEPSSTRSD